MSEAVGPDDIVARLLPKSPTNILYPLRDIIGFQWQNPVSVMPKIAYQFKLAGFDFRTDEELSLLLSQLSVCGFLESKITGNSLTGIRVNPSLKDI